MNIKRILILGLTIFFFTNFYGQSVNEYKYIIVPDNYGFIDKNDGYQLNSLTKFLFNKNGFNTLMQSDNLPEDLIRNGCLGLRADVSKKSGLFATKLVIELKNCNGVAVFTSSEGVSREKEFRKAYHGALRDAFKDVKKLRYTYKPKEEATTERPAVIPVVDKKKEVPEATSVGDVKETNIKNQEQLKEPKKAVVPGVTSKVTSYTFNGAVYTFQKKEYGYELVKGDSGQSISIGKIYKSTSGSGYIVKAGDLSGNGYFDSYGNFILERINPVTDKLITDTFARQ